MNKAKLFPRMILFTILVAGMHERVFPHEPWVHQHIVVQAWELFKQQYPAIQNSDMATHVGTVGENAIFTSEYLDYDWGTATITAGAWREDVTDPVRRTNSITNVTSTHFWNADNGDYSTNNFFGTDYINANHKAFYYWEGVFTFVVEYGHENYTVYNKVGGGTLTIGWNYGVILGYRDLIDFYKTGRATIFGYFFQNDGSSYPDWQNNNPNVTSLPSPVEVYFPAGGRKDGIVWQVLGRIAHLLGDMSVPVHTHLQIHPCPIEDNGDTYELWMGLDDGSYPSCQSHIPSSFHAQNWTYQHSGVQSGLINSVGTANPLRYLFYSTNQITAHFPSNAVNGLRYRSGENNYFSGSNGGQVIFDRDDYSTISDVTGSFGNPPSSVNHTDIANGSFTYAIRATAGLLYLFASQAGLLPTTTLKNSFDHGLVKFQLPGSTLQQYKIIGRDGIGFLTPASSTVTLEAVQQDIVDPANGQVYTRVFSEWIRSSNGQRFPTNPLTVQVSGSELYTADLKKQFNVVVTAPTFIESGVAGSYNITAPSGTYNNVQTWSGTVVDGQLIRLEAVIQSGDGVFIGWSDGNTINPRDLIPGNHTTLYATFKKHLASTSPTVTGPNSQRKLDSFGYLTHGAYASGGSIWYMSNDGSGWNNEKLIAYSTSAKNPSIAVTYVAPYTAVHVVWEDITYYNGSEYHDVYYRSSTNSGASWGNTIRLTYPYYWYYGPPGATDIDATPVVAGNPIVVVYKSGNAYGGALHVQVDPLFGGGYYYTMDGSDVTSRTPSLRPMDYGSYKVAYMHGPGKIYYREFNLTGSYPYYSVQFDNSKAADLTSGYNWMSDCADPSIVFDGSRVFVAWDAYSDQIGVVEDGPITQQRHVFCRERIASGIWQPVVEFDYYGAVQKNPSVAVNYNIGKVVLQWEGNGAILKSSRDIGGGSWSNISDLGAGVLPSLTHYLYGGNPPYAMYTSGTTSPYAISFNTNLSRLFDNGHLTDKKMEDGPELDPIASGPVVRRGTICLDSLTFRNWGKGDVLGDLWIDSPTFEVMREGTPELLPFASDTMDFSDWMGTISRTAAANADQIRGTAVITLKNFRIANRRVPLYTSIFTTTVLSGNNDQRKVYELTLDDLNRLGASDTVIKVLFRVSANPFRNRPLRVKQRWIGQENEQYQITWSSLITSDSGNATSIKSSLAKISAPGSLAIPKAFAFHQSYPNPFNPSTQINFDLPQPSQVSLVIYDVLGRKLTELSNGFKEAGYHSVTWNASDAASGVYFARFTATDASGNVKLSKVSKLLLTK